MTFPTSEPIPPEDQSLPPARRRRQKRLDFLHAGSEERTAYLAEIAHQSTPSVDFFLFSILAALVMGAAILLDAPALYILVILMTPFLSPVTGMALGSILGSLRFLATALGALFIHVIIFFGCGLLAGVGAKAWLSTPPTRILDHSILSLPDLALVIIGAGLTTYLLLRNPQQRPQVASVALAYEISLPVGMAGFGITSGMAGLFPDAALVFIVHLVVAVVTAVLVLIIMRFQPRTPAGIGISLAWLILAVIGMMLILGIISLNSPSLSKLPNTSAPPLSMTASPMVNQETNSPIPPGVTLTTPNPAAVTSTPTLIPSSTPTLTITPQPTPIYARVWARDGNGAFVRDEPGFNGRRVTSLLNSSLVQVISNPVLVDNLAWVKVRTETGLEGWMVQSLLSTATPSPDW